MSAERYGAYSVLMSVYSKENPAWLKLAIESIQDQTLPTSDFVLVCDGPLTPELDGVIAEKHCQMGEILMVVRLEKNVGLGNALNEGIKHCRNELVARMDSDDIAYPDRCEKQVAIFNMPEPVVDANPYFFFAILMLLGGIKGVECSFGKEDTAESERGF